MLQLQHVLRMCCRGHAIPGHAGLTRWLSTLATSLTMHAPHMWLHVTARTQNCIVPRVVGSVSSEMVEGAAVVVSAALLFFFVFFFFGVACGARHDLAAPNIK